MANENKLSEREVEILHLLATGASNKEIAQQLVISANTVKVHLRNIFAKIGVVSRTEATLYAIRQGIISMPGQPPAKVAENPLDGSQQQAQAVESEPPSWLDRLSAKEIPAEETALPNGTVLQAGKKVRWARWGIALALAAVAVLALMAASGLLRQPGMGVASTLTATAASDSRWSTRTSLPGGRRGLAAVAYDGKIYAIGGETVDGVSADVLRFDPVRNSWQVLAPKPLAVSDIQAAIVDEIIYVPGGRLASGAATDALEVYDPRHDSWSQKAHLPQPVSGYALVAFEGRLFLFGGQNGKSYLNTVYEYNPNQDTWSQRTSMLTRRAFMGAAAVTGKIYVVGGFDGQNPLPDNEVYFPTRDGPSESAWEKGRALPEGRYGMGMTGLADTIFIVGGKTGSSKANANAPSPAVALQSDAWQAIESPFPAGERFNSSLVALADHLYLIGGTLGKNLSDQNLAYQAIYILLLPVQKK